MNFDNILVFSENTCEHTCPKKTNVPSQQAPTCPFIPADFGLSAPQPRSPKTPYCTVLCHTPTTKHLIGTPRYLSPSSTLILAALSHPIPLPHAYTSARICINISIIIPDRFRHGLFLVILGHISYFASRSRASSFLNLFFFKRKTSIPPPFNTFTMRHS